MESICTVASKLHWKRIRCWKQTGMSYRQSTLQLVRLTLQVTKILVPFKQLTKLGQSKNNDLGSIAGVLWGFDMLLEVLEKAITRKPMPRLSSRKLYGSYFQLPPNASTRFTEWTQLPPSSIVPLKRLCTSNRRRDTSIPNIQIGYIYCTKRCMD